MSPKRSDRAAQHTDITYVPTWAGFLYLAIVLDVFSRKVVGWAMATHLRTELALEALDLAITQRRPKDVIHHSDQGCQLGFKESSQRSSASCSTESGARRRSRPAWRSSSGSRRGTTRSVDTRRSATSRRASSSAGSKPGRRAGAPPPHPWDERRRSWKRGAIGRSPKALDRPRKSGNSREVNSPPLAARIRVGVDRLRPAPISWTLSPF